MISAIKRRWYVVVSSVLIALLIAGFVLILRGSPNRAPTLFSSTVTLSVASNAEDAPLPAPEDLPSRLLVSQTGVAQNPAVENQALHAAGRSPGDGTRFKAKAEDSGRMSFIVYSTQKNVAENVASKWVDAFVEARRQITADDLQHRQSSAVTAIGKTRRDLKKVIRQLYIMTAGHLPTVVFFPPNQEQSTGTQQEEILPTLENRPQQVALLAYQRAGLKNLLEAELKEYGDVTANLATPDPFVRRGFQGSPHQLPRPSPKSSMKTPGMILLIGVVAGFLAAILFDRVDRTIRTAAEATAVLDVPVLATIPLARRQEVVVFADPGSERSEAYRTLAATCVATERLPSAIMVTTPRGDACDDVAVNFAAALANLGVKVALVATSPDQTWFQEAFPPSPEGTPTFPELLAQAHVGTISGQLRRLVVSNATPNLLLVPPGSDPDEELALDGLRPLLEALSDEGIELTILAGPALLENADATIVAWTTRTVLWALGAGEVRRSAAAEAVARLELTGVTAFGATVVGGEAA